MRCRWCLLLSLLLLAGGTWEAQAATSQFGWGQRERALRLSLAQSIGQGGAGSSNWQQPMTVSINPPKPAATAVPPLPPLQPAPATFTLPATDANAVPSAGVRTGFRPPKTTARSSLAGISNTVDGTADSSSSSSSDGAAVGGTSSSNNAISDAAGTAVGSSMLSSSAGRSSTDVNSGSSDKSTAVTSPDDGTDTSSSSSNVDSLAPDDSSSSGGGSSSKADSAANDGSDDASSSLDSKNTNGSKSASNGSSGSTGSSSGMTADTPSGVNVQQLMPGQTQQTPKQQQNTRGLPPGSTVISINNSNARVIDINTVPKDASSSQPGNAASSSSSTGSTVGPSGSTQGQIGTGLGQVGPGTNQVMTQFAAGNTIQVVQGANGPVSTVTSQQPQQVTIISITPAGELVANNAGGRPLVWGSNQGASTPWRQQQQLKNSASSEVLPAVDELQQSDLQEMPLARSSNPQGATAAPRLLKKQQKPRSTAAEDLTAGQGLGTQPNFAMGSEPSEATVPDVNGVLKPAFGGSKAAGHAGSHSSSKPKAAKRPPMMHEVDSLAPDDTAGASAGGILDGFEPADEAEEPEQQQQQQQQQQQKQTQKQHKHPKQQAEEQPQQQPKPHPKDQPKQHHKEEHKQHHKEQPKQQPKPQPKQQQPQQAKQQQAHDQKTKQEGAQNKKKVPKKKQHDSTSKGPITDPLAKSIPRPCGCPSFNFNFACGMDGLTYANPCMARCAGVEVSRMGPCEVAWQASDLSSNADRDNSRGSANRDTSSSSSGSSTNGIDGRVKDSSSNGGSSSSKDLREFVVVHQDQPAAELDSTAAAGDYEYYYEDGRPPVPAPPRPQNPPGADPAPLPPNAPAPRLPSPVPVPAVPLPSPVAPAPTAGSNLGQDVSDLEDDLSDLEEDVEDIVEDVQGPAAPGRQPQPPSPASLPAVFGPEPIPEDLPQTPVPPPLPVKLTNPAPPKDTKGSTPKNPIPSVPVRVRPPTPPPSPPRDVMRPPVPISTIPLDGTDDDDSSSGAIWRPKGQGRPKQQDDKPKSMLPDLAGKQIMQPPKPWVLDQEDSAKTILIGCILPFEGDLRIAGNAVYHALKLAISEEAPALLPGVNVNLTCINTKCADIPAHMAMTRFAQDKAVAVVGEVCSAATVAAAGVSSTSKMPLISPAATSPALSGEDFFFRTVPSDRFQGQAAARLLIGKGCRNVAMVYEDAAYGYGLAFNFIAAFTKEGGNVPVVVMFKKQQGKPKQDVLAIKADIEAKNLDAVFMASNNLTYAAGFLKAAENQDLGLKIFSGDALADPMMVSLLRDQPSALKDLSVTTVNKGKNPFIKKFRSTFPHVTYGSFAAQGYDAMVALLRAYAAAAAPKDGPAIVKQLERERFEGVSGPISFDKYGDVVPHNRTYMWIRHNTTTGVPTVKGYIQRMV